MYIYPKVKVLIKCSAISVYKILKRHLTGIGFYQNINYDPNRRQKRVLISYITYPFEHNCYEQVRHTSKVEVSLIIKAFIDKDCVLDVIDCDNIYDICSVTQQHYDYIFGFGKPWMAAVEANPKATAVMYLTECAPRFSEEQEQARLDYYALRHNKVLSLTRSNRYFLDEHIQKAHIGGFFGNLHTAKAYIQQFPLMKLRLLSPSGFFNKDFDNCLTGKVMKSFLWFGSWGAIHKGLDILLDVFKDIPEANLYIAGLNSGEKWLLDDYRRYKNIKDMGFVNVQSEKFLDLMKKVSFCILPSASEGMSTSVLTCMRHGLIPVITPSCGIDVKDYGYFIEDYHVGVVAKLVRELMQISEEELLQKKQAVFVDANKRYSLEAFDEGLRDFVDSFVK